MILIQWLAQSWNSTLISTQWARAIVSQSQYIFAISHYQHISHDIFSSHLTVVMWKNSCSLSLLILMLLFHTLYFDYCYIIHHLPTTHPNEQHQQTMTQVVGTLSRQDHNNEEFTTTNDGHNCCLSLVTTTLLRTLEATSQQTNKHQHWMTELELNNNNNNIAAQVIT